MLITRLASWPVSECGDNRHCPLQQEIIVGKQRLLYTNQEANQVDVKGTVRIRSYRRPTNGTSQSLEENLYLYSIAGLS